MSNNKHAIFGKFDGKIYNYLGVNDSEFSVNYWEKNSIVSIYKFNEKETFFKHNNKEIIAIGLTNELGEFLINPDNKFNPQKGDEFIIEIYTRLSQRIISLRSYLVWDEKGWLTITKSSKDDTYPIYIDSKTTALTILKKNKIKELIGTVDITEDHYSKIYSSENEDIELITKVNSKLPKDLNIEEVNKLSKKVKNLISMEIDPLSNYEDYDLRYISNLLKLTKTKSCESCILAFLDITNENLKNVNLKESNLFMTKLENSNLENANLNKANLEESNLENTNFTNANLENVNFEKAKVNGMILEKANYKGANFSNQNIKTIKWKSENKLDLTSLDFTDVDFSNADLSGLNLSNSNLKNVNFSGANLNFTNFTNANLENVNFEKAKVNGMILEKANYKGANFSDQNIKTIKWGNKFELDLTNLDFTEVNFSGVNLTNINFNNSNLERVNLERANLTATNFKKANLSNAIWSDGNVCLEKKEPNGICR